MDFEFESDDLKRLYETGEGKEKYPLEVVTAYVRRMLTIAAAPDERAFYVMKSLHFEKLKGAGDRRSMRLNQDWRLILTLDKSDPAGTVVRIVEINRHYGD